MKRILCVVSEVGYTWEEVIVPYLTFLENGYTVDFATITGGEPVVDPLSIINRPLLSQIGFGVSEDISPSTPAGKALQVKLATVIGIEAVNPSQYEGIFLAGGHGSLFDMNKSQKLHGLILAFDQLDKKIMAICHASSTLAYVQKNGKSLIADKRVTGFPTFNEYIILTFRMIHKTFLPLPIWTEKELNRVSRKRTLWMKIWGVLNAQYAVKDGNIITGVGPKAGRTLVEKAISK